jgi:glycosyltransferase involved in cell wall biosynthesis
VIPELCRTGGRGSVGLGHGDASYEPGSAPGCHELSCSAVSTSSATDVVASVIIPVRDDPARLAICLGALGRQTFPHPFEIIVVDNGSKQPPREVVDQEPRARLLNECKPGSYAARNTGVRSARGRFLAFTDSDCVPADDWLETGCDLLDSSPTPTFVVGHVAVFPADPSRPTGPELYEMAHAFAQRLYAAESFGATANILVERSAFDRVGAFDESLASGGDEDWGRRAGGAGVRAVYSRQTEVGHPARRSYGEVASKARRVSAARAARREQRDRRLITGHHLRLLAPPVRILRAGWPQFPTIRLRLRYSVAAVIIHWITSLARVRAALERRRG